jgi:putative ribosome biogenesis GTPase RsgA
MPMDKSYVLRETSFGKRIAEDEAVELATYFVETEQWRKIYDGDVDVVYGSKGAGKSAIYSLLNSRQDNLFGPRTGIAGKEMA